MRSYAYSSGPPVKGAPWRLRGAPYGLGAVVGGTSGGTVAPTPPVRSGRGKPFIRRDPRADRRQGRNWEILTEIINSLLVQGSLYEDPRGVWNISATGMTSGLTGTFPE